MRLDKTVLGIGLSPETRLMPCVSVVGALTNEVMLEIHGKQRLCWARVFFAMSKAKQ